MANRFDISNVKPLGAYATKRCPLRIQLDVVPPATPPLPDSDEAKARMSEGRAFEARIVARLRELHPEWTFLDLNNCADPAGETASALASGAPGIVGGVLPIDEHKRRSGRPDVLVHTGDGYVPIDIKGHATLDHSARGSTGATSSVSTLEHPQPARRRDRAGTKLRKNKGDALQLAHYRAMLESAGYADPSRLAGIIGKDECVVWYELDRPMWRTPAKSDGTTVKTRTTIEVYDFEFDFRIDMAAAIRIDSDAHRLAPVRCAECDECKWRGHCRPILEAPPGDTSLIPGIGYRPWRRLRDAGIENRRDVADLDLLTARLAKDKVDVARLLNAAQKAEPNSPVTKLLPKAKRQIETAQRYGLQSAGEVLARIDTRTATLADIGQLRDAIIDARAVLGPEKIYRSPLTPCIEVPTADVEIDVDMESFDGEVYLWGTYAPQHPAEHPATNVYREFVSWEPLSAEVERVLFARFWTWLTELRATCEREGRTLRAYAWHASAEHTHMRRIAAHDGAWLDAVDAFIESDAWVDLEAVFNRHWTTGEGSKLKDVARRVGHRWEVDDPGGATSLLHYACAIGDDSSAAGDSAAARHWLLRYNRDDVIATAVLRRWMIEHGEGCPLPPK